LGRGQLGDVCASHHDLSATDIVQPTDEIEQCRFPASAGPHERHPFAGLYLEIDRLEYLCLSKLLGNAAAIDGECRGECRGKGSGCAHLHLSRAGIVAGQPSEPRQNPETLAGGGVKVSSQRAQ
jgi:hypothetical protein